MADQLQNLKEYIPMLRSDNLIRQMSAPPTANRKWRFIPIVLAGIKLAISGVTSALGMYKTHQMRKRIQSIQQDVNILARHNFKLTKAVIHLNQSLTALAMATNNEITQIHSTLHKVDEKLDTLTHLDPIHQNMNNIAKLAHVNKLMTFATTTQINQLLVLNAVNELTFYSERLLNRLTNAFHSLSLGYLTREMI